jgi:quercetin dioxygenase-like cupin family protein
MTHISAADAPIFTMHGAQFTGLASPSRGATETAAWRVAVAPGSAKGATHQLSREEILVALRGSAFARIGEAEYVFREGDAIIIPAFTDFSLGNPSDQPFEAIAIFPVGGRALLPGEAPFTPPWAA